MTQIKALLSLYGPKIAALLVFLGSISDMYLHGVSTTDILAAVMAGGLALAKGFATTGGTVPAPNAAVGTVPDSLLPPK